MNGNQFAAVEQVERALLSTLLFDGSLWPKTEGLDVEDFFLGAHREIYHCMLAMHSEGLPVDIKTLGLELANRGKFEYCSVDSLVDPGLSANFPAYVKNVKEAAGERRHQHLLESLAQATPGEQRVKILSQMLDLSNGNSCEQFAVRILSEVETKTVNWLWEPYIPFGMLTIITGDPGVGKSFIALAIAAKETRAGRVVLYLTVENSAAYTLRPRFDALAGDASKLILLDEITADGIRRAVTLQDFAVLEKVIRDYKVQLVVIDPIQSYLGAGVDAHRSNETRPILDGLAKIAEQYHLAVLILRHAAKNTSGRAIFKGLGSIDFTGAVRSELFAGETLEKQRALCHIKSNIGPLGPAQGYEISSTDEHGHLWPAGCFRWTGDSNIAVGDLTEPEEASGTGAADDAEAFLRDALSDGPKPAKVVIKEARDGGISERTLDRAKAKLRIKSRKGGNGWEWLLPVEKPARAPNTKLGTLETVEALKQHTINNIGKDAKSAKNATLERVGTLDGTLERTLPKCSVCGSYALYKGECQSCELT